jgi:hypothetical protein
MVQTSHSLENHNIFWKLSWQRELFWRCGAVAFFTVHRFAAAADYQLRWTSLINSGKTKYFTREQQNSVLKTHHHEQYYQISFWNFYLSYFKHISSTISFPFDSFLFATISFFTEWCYFIFALKYFYDAIFNSFTIRSDISNLKFLEWSNP